MKIIVDPASPAFPFVQVADALRSMITTGELGPRMPPMSEVAAAADVAVGTVQRAYKLLADEGLITTVKGRGTFVVSR